MRVRLNRAQLEAVKALWLRSTDCASCYRKFRKRIAYSTELGCVIRRSCVMDVRNEADGWTHT